MCLSSYQLKSVGILYCAFNLQGYSSDRDDELDSFLDDSDEEDDMFDLTEDSEGEVGEEGLVSDTPSLGDSSDSEPVVTTRTPRSTRQKSSVNSTNGDKSRLVLV